MSPTVRRLFAPFIGSLVMAGILGTILAPSALGALTRRTWTAALGGGGMTGSAVLAVNTNSTAWVTVTIQGLKPSTVYTQQVYTGSCGQPNTVVKLPGLAIDANGAGSRTMALNATQGTAIWRVAADHAIAIRIATATEAHCAALSYPLATRIAISKYGINLPIVKQRGSAYPLCNVALYLPILSQPGERGVTFIFAHARAGMFLPLLTASKVNDGNAMIGTTVRVWTDDNRLFTYQITKVLRHTYTFPNYDPVSEQLFLQTSEGPHGTPNKLVIVARRLSVTAVSFAEAHPTPHPVVCH